MLQWSLLESEGIPNCDSPRPSSPTGAFIRGFEGIIRPNNLPPTSESLATSLGTALASALWKGLTGATQRPRAAVEASGDGGGDHVSSSSSFGVRSDGEVEAVEAVAPTDKADNSVPEVPTVASSGQGPSSVPSPAARELPRKWEWGIRMRDRTLGVTTSAMTRSRNAVSPTYNLPARSSLTTMFCAPHLTIIRKCAAPCHTPSRGICSNQKRIVSLSRAVTFPGSFVKF